MNNSFEDVYAHPWARNELDILYSKGIMKNKKEDRFLPNDSISRAEFVSLLVKVFDMPLNYTEAPTFVDVKRYNPQSGGLYDYKSIETAARAGIIRGIGANRFMPDKKISRQDAAVLLARAAQLSMNQTPEATAEALSKSFTDAEKINYYARPAVNAIQTVGWLQGKINPPEQAIATSAVNSRTSRTTATRAGTTTRTNNAASTSRQKVKDTFRFDPDDTFTRAEMATVLIRILQQQGKLPRSG
jgi:hypothetical protein